MRPFRACLVLMIGACMNLGAQTFHLEAALGWSSPMGELQDYGKPGPVGEFRFVWHFGDDRWGWRTRLQLSSFSPRHRETVESPAGIYASTLVTDRRAAAFTGAFEALTPAVRRPAIAMKAVLGFGPEVWRLEERETRRYLSGVLPDDPLTDRKEAYFGWQFAAGLRVEAGTRVNVEVRYEASRVAFLGILEDRRFHAPQRWTTSVGWRF